MTISAKRNHENYKKIKNKKRLRDKAEQRGDKATAAMHFKDKLDLELKTKAKRPGFRI